MNNQSIYLEINKDKGVVLFNLLNIFSKSNFNRSIALDPAEIKVLRELEDGLKFCLFEELSDINFDQKLNQTKVRVKSKILKCPNTDWAMLL